MKLILALILVALGALPAEAHAFLESSDPAVGGTLKASPTEVQIWFTRELSKDGSTIRVFDAKGAEVEDKPSAVDPKDRFRMTVAVPKLPPGLFKVAWSATCLGDGHHTTGSFTFEVAK